MLSISDALSIAIGLLEGGFTALAQNSRGAKGDDTADLNTKHGDLIVEAGESGGRIRSENANHFIW